jgi:hypothetical protein
MWPKSRAVLRFLALVVVGSVPLLLGACTPNPGIVIVLYRENIQFQTYAPEPLDGNPTGTFYFAMFYTIT